MGKLKKAYPFFGGNKAKIVMNYMTPIPTKIAIITPPNEI